MNISFNLIHDLIIYYITHIKKIYNKKIQNLINQKQTLKRKMKLEYNTLGKNIHQKMKYFFLKNFLKFKNICVLHKNKKINIKLFQEVNEMQNRIYRNQSKNKRF